MHTTVMYLSLADSNMQVRFGLKVVWESWVGGIWLMTFSGLFLWVGSSKTHYFIDFKNLSSSEHLSGLNDLNSPKITGLNDLNSLFGL